MADHLPQHLMLPGPTPLPQPVLQAMATPMLNHRSEAFSELYREVEAGAQWLCRTEREILMLAGSGTTGMEASLCNLFSPGEPVLAIAQGSFSERFAKMAETFGLSTDVLTYDWGQAALPAELDARLSEGSAQGPYKAVLIVHNETSTGVLNPLAELTAICRRHGALSMVDAISSLGSTPLEVDAWGIDVAITASQKGYYAPAGLTLMMLSEAAWQACETATLPRFSLDLRLAREYGRKAQTPWTPPLPVFYALRAGFGLLRAEGLEAIHARHLAITRALRRGLTQLGLELFVPDEFVASRCVTPVYPPAGLAADEIRRVMLAKHNIILGAGLRKLSGKMFRIGHLGHHDLAEALGVLECLRLSLDALREFPSAGA